MDILKSVVCTQIQIEANSFQDPLREALTLEPTGVCKFIWICLCFGVFLVRAVSTMLGIESCRDDVQNGQAGEGAWEETGMSS